MAGRANGVLFGCFRPLRPSAPRELAAALVAAADECKTMAGYDRIGFGLPRGN
jgi:hypothetical protein